MLPEIVVGGERFYDMSSIVMADVRPRVRTIGLAVNHSVGPDGFTDKNMNGTTMDEEIQHIKNVEAFHVGKWGYGFGYDGIVFKSGRVYVVGQGLGQRAHTARRNHELTGICMAGDYSNVEPGLGVVLGTARWVAAKWRQHGDLPVQGHSAWAVPGWETFCPGDGGRRAIPKIITAAKQILVGHPPVDEEKVRAAIRDALAPAFIAADLQKMAGQIAWITGGKICG